MLKATVATIAFMTTVTFFGQTAHADVFSKLETVISKLEPVYNPLPILIPAGKSPQQVSGAIRRSLLAKEWQIQNAEKGRIEARYNSPKLWHATVDIQYDSESIRMTYKDSKGLKYNSGTGMIHKMYAGAVRDLEKVIQGQIRN
jgi:hypothetical protein